MVFPNICHRAFVAPLISIVVLLSPCPAGAQAAQDTIPAGSWAFDALALLYAEADLAPPAIEAPMPRSELRVYLEALSVHEYSASGLATLGRLRNLAGPAGADSEPALRATLQAGLELRYRSEEAFPWANEAADRPSLLAFPIAFDLGDTLTAFADLELREGYWVSTLSSEDLAGNRNWSNLPDSPDYLDVGIPRRAGLSAGGEYWNFQLARDRVDMGAAWLGATTVSRSLDRVDFARLSFFADTFAWRTQVIQLQPLPIELAVDEDQDGAAESWIPSSIQRYIYVHRLDWRPSPRFSFGFTEGVFVAQPPELRFLNPLASFHALAAWKHYGDSDDSIGSLLGLDLGWSPVSGLRIYGQLTCNQIKTPFPSEAGSVQPDAYAALGGAAWSRALGEGYLSLSAEGYYATPWFATLYGKEWSFLALRRELVAPPGLPGRDILAWVGSPYGRDAAVLSLKAAWSEPGLRGLGLEYRFAALGENSLDPLDDWDSWYENPVEPADIDGNAAMVAPSGTPILDHGLFLRGSTEYESWSLSAMLGTRLRFNAGHEPSATRAGWEFALSASRRIF